MTEEQAAQFVLIHSVEETGGEAFSGEDLTGALEYAGRDFQGTAWLVKRASYLMDRLPQRYHGMLTLAKLPGPWTLPVSLLAFAVGVGTNLLGPADKIHVVRNPVALFVAWNLLVYIVLVLLLARKTLPALNLSRFSAKGTRAGRRGETRESAPARGGRRVPWVVETLLPGLWRWFHAMSFRYRQTKTLTQTATRFWGHWLQLAGPLMTARWKRLLHFGATFLALGATLGMYFRGLFQGYEVVWASTYIRSEQSVSAFIHFVFGPAFLMARLLAWDALRAVDVRRLLDAGGDPAGPWIHLFAVTVVLAVVLPRLALAAWQGARIRRLKSGLPLVFDRYYGAILASPIRSLVEQGIREAVGKLAGEVASHLTRELYDGRIVPMLRAFREKGGRIAALRSEIKTAAEGFTPGLTAYLRDRALENFQANVASAMGKIFTGMAGEVYRVPAREELAARARVAAPEDSADAIGHEYGDAVGAALTVSVGAVLGTVSGGFGKTLGLSIVTALLGTTGPVGFLVGALAGIVAAGAAWRFGREKITEFVEGIVLPAAVTRATLWESRFQKLVDEGRTRCRETVVAGIAAQMNPLAPEMAEEILTRVQTHWES